MKKVDLVREELEVYLNDKYKYSDDSLVVLSEDTIERDQYWFFFTLIENIWKRTIYRILLPEIHP